MTQTIGSSGDFSTTLEPSEPMLTDQHLEKLVNLLNLRFPDWKGFSDERFSKDEIDYKKDASELAKELLGREAIETLIAAGDFDGLKENIEVVARKSNLLYLSMPQQGDLSLIYEPSLPWRDFSKRFLELLHGSAESPTRLAQYVGWLQDGELPNKWTFPTYFLFLLHPDTDLFIKPAAMTRIFEALGREERFRGKPSSELYVSALRLAQELRVKLAQHQPESLIDIQSFLFVAASELEKLVVPDQKVSRFEELFAEMDQSYLPRDEGQKHAEYYRHQESLKTNFKNIRSAAAAGQDITDRVLLQLLPHMDTTTNRERGAWISHAPAVSRDIRPWFEGAGLTTPDSWPTIALDVLHFFEACIDKPASYQKACKAFTDKPTSKGFQSGMLSPTLAILQPHNFSTLNSKSRKVLNWLAGTKHSQQLAHYPEANDALKKVIGQLSPILESLETELDPAFAFDMFCHWLVSEKKYSFKSVRNWKIAPGEGGTVWGECLEGGHIAIGWNELGDLTGFSRRVFSQRRDEVAAEQGWTKTALEQAWKFSRIAEGDRVVANRGTTEVLGIGTVTGPYFFVEGEEYGHRLPVEWGDVLHRDVIEKDWKRTLVEIDEEKFRSIEKTGGAGGPTETAFEPQAFELLSGLRQSPTKAFYLDRRREFDQLVESPFKALFARVVESLPEAIFEWTETEKNVYGRILKNDWGRGGAWDYFWGSLYPKGGRRIEGAQLFVGMNQAELEYGFSFGDYAGEDQARFLANCREHPGVLRKLFSDLEGLESVEIGTHGQGVAIDESESWKEWLEDVPAIDPRAVVLVPKEDVLSTSGKELESKIAIVFERLFPLFLMAALDDPLPAIRSLEDPGEDRQEAQPLHTLATIATETSFEVSKIERWLRAIERKKQAILYGPPGTGKTYLAEHLARHIVGGGQGFRQLLQFHPSYAYEDFVQGIRPRLKSGNVLTYEMVPGQFKDFCARAAQTEDPCVLIIDEINRANLSRVFGELMYLLEYRDREVALPGGGSLQIPENVRILGTMNTADRSIALVDHALRRRFAFIALWPNYEVIQKFHEDGDFNPEGLIGLLADLNSQIGDPHYQIGMSFFLRRDLSAHLEDIWRMEIEPYLEEYFFDQSAKAEAYRWDKVRHRLIDEEPP